MKKILLTALLATGVVAGANAAIPTNPAFSISSNYTGTYALSSPANYKVKPATADYNGTFKTTGRYYVNAGHGGYDSDDRPTPMPLLGTEYFYESEGNLDRAKHMEKWLNGNGGVVKMSRYENTSAYDLNLTSIATYSSSYGGYFISLHSNGANASANYHVALYKGSNSNDAVNGSERMAYYNSYNSYKNGCLSNATYSTPRSMADYDLMGWHYGVLRTNTAPGYLVETWFHDYRPESLRMKSSLYNKFLAWQIAVGCTKAPGGSGSLPGCIVGDVRDVSKGCGYSNYTARGRDAKLALNNVTVTLTGNGLNQTVNTGTKCNGVYAFFVPAGTYTITVKKDGYKTQTHTLTVTNSKATQKNIDLVEGVDSGIALNPATAEFGETAVGNTSTKTITVTGTSLTSNITISNSNNTHFAISKTSLGTAGGTFVVTYKPQSAGSHSTTISFASGTHKASMVIDGTAKNPPLTFTEGWNYSEKNGKKAGWMANYTNYRNMAYGNGKLYVVDATKTVVKIINAQTGAHIKDMNMTGVSGGALALVDVAYVDGKILGTNIAISSDDTKKTLKVYQWDNDDAAPKVILSTTNIGGMNRIGDAIEIQGNLTSGKICYLAQQTRDYTDAEGNAKSGNCNSIVTYAITNGTVSTTPVVADIDAFIVGMSPRAIPDGNNFWVAGQSYLPSQVTANGQLTASVPLTAFNIEAAFHGCGNDFVPFTFKGNKYAFATDYQPVTKAGSAATTDEIKTTTLLGGRAILIDGSDGWAVEGLKNSGSYPSAGMSSNTRNTTYSSSICVNVDGDKGVEMWVLIHNQGIAYYKHGTPGATDPGTTPSEPVTPPTPSEPSVSYSKGITKVWQNTAKVPGSAAYNGTGPRFAAVSNGKMIASDKENNKIVEITESGYSDYYDPSAAITANYSQTIGVAIATDDAGNILVNSGFGAAGSSSNFTIISADLSKTYKLDLSGISGYTTAGSRVDQIGRIRGNMLSAEGAYFTILPNTLTYAVVVKVVNGALASSELVETGLTNTTSFIAQPAYETVAEMSSNMKKSFILRSRGVPQSVYTWGSASTMDKGYTFTAAAEGGYTTAKAGVEGFDWFKLGGKSYFIMPMTAAGTDATRGSYFGIYDQDGNLVANWAEGQKTTGNAAFGSFVVVPNDAYSVHIYHFVPATIAEKLLFAPEDVSISTGVEEIATDVEAPVEYYNLQGVRVMNPENGLYIKRQGNKVTKVIL